MKKLMILTMVMLMMMVGCQNNQEVNTEKIYNVLTEAQEEQRELSTKEIVLIEEWEVSTISLERNDLDHAVHAMYFNFKYPSHFNIAKVKAEQLMN